MLDSGQQRHDDPAGASPPDLAILQLEMTANCSDTELLSNLESCKALNLPKLRVAEPNDRILAIVGSGPSLEDFWDQIPPECDILALNGAYKFLRARNITPKYFAMLDARAVNTNFLEDLSTETLFLLASQCHPEVFAKLEGFRHGVFHLNTATTRKAFAEEELYVGGGGTVGLTSLGIALALGYRHVKLYGFDSSVRQKRRHVLEQPQNATEELVPVWVQDRMYLTTHAMAAQVMDFFPFYTAIQKSYPDFIVDIHGSGLFYDFVTTNNHEISRERELAKYHAAYQEDSYGMSEGRRNALDELLGTVSGESYLDVSTGRGEALDLAQKHGFQMVAGTETVPNLLNDRVSYGVLPYLNILDKAYDVVSLIEVIEHLVPEDVEPALRELTRIARKTILISAATQPHWLGGVNMHPSARPEEEWDALFKSIWGDKVRKTIPMGFSPCWRVDL